MTNIAYSGCKNKNFYNVDLKNKFMAEYLEILDGSKKEQYESLIPQIKGLLSGENDLRASDRSPGYRVVFPGKFGR